MKELVAIPKRDRLLGARGFGGEARTVGTVGIG